MAGLDLIPEQHCDGVSIAPVLKGDDLARDAIFWHFPHYGNQGGTPGSSVRAGDYKLIECVLNPGMWSCTICERILVRRVICQVNCPMCEINCTRS